MLKSQAELLAELDKIGVEYVNTEHPAVFTVEEANQYQEGIKGAHSKNLFLKDKKGNLFLVVTLSHKPINLKELEAKIDSKRLSFGKPELLNEVLGVRSGSVSPFAVINASGHDIRVILDEEMMENELLNYHPLENTATTTIAANDLTKFVEHCGKQPEIIRL